MAFKRYPRRQIRRKKVAWYNRKYSTMQLAAKAWRATKYLKGLVNSEMLHLDQTLTMGGARSSIAPLTNIAQNDTVAGRTGNSILLRSIYFRGYIQINSAVTGLTRASLFIVKDKQQTSDTYPSLSDIFSDSTDPDTMLNVNSVGRYKIVYRKNFVLTPVSGGGLSSIHFQKYLKLYNHVRYNGTANTDIQKNGFYLILITSEATNFVTCQANTRTSYHDN